MARADYYELECAIGRRLSMDDQLAEVGVEVLIEEEMSPYHNRQVILYLDSYEVPTDYQGINAGSRMRMHVKYILACYALHLKIADAMELRDDLMGRVSVSLMRDTRTFDRPEVRSSWQTGGEFANGRMESGAQFMAMGEIGLIVDLEATTS